MGYGRKKIAKIDRLDAYLFKCVRNAVFAHNRKQSINTVEAEDCTLIAASLYSPDASLNAKQTSQAIESVVQKLPSQCQMVFRLAKEEGMSYKEIESVLGIGENSIKTHMRIALKRIRIALNDSFRESAKEKKL